MVPGHTLITNSHFVYYKCRFANIQLSKGQRKKTEHRKSGTEKMINQTLKIKPDKNYSILKKKTHISDLLL